MELGPKLLVLRTTSVKSGRVESPQIVVKKSSTSPCGQHEAVCLLLNRQRVPNLPRQGWLANLASPLEFFLTGLLTAAMRLEGKFSQARLHFQVAISLQFLVGL